MLPMLPMLRTLRMKTVMPPFLAALLCSGAGTGAQASPDASCTVKLPSQTEQGGARIVRYRKNIDDLTPAELAAFKHAVSEMKRKSQENVYDRRGFLWQAWVHNCPSVDVFNDRKAALPGDGLKWLLSDPTRNSCDVAYFLDKPPTADNAHEEFPGECEHQKNTFLQWHRAQLYFYEQALQAADPKGERGPSTRDVALPYWNFTRKPSGVRYPQAFEDVDSPLFDVTRNKGGLDSSLATASPNLLAYQIYYMEWADFGGDEYGSLGGGNLETKIHNHMHAIYMGGNMGNNVTAGLDPLFYAFHNFLDYSFEKWLDEHGDAGIGGSARTAFMRSEQDASLPRPVGWSAGDGDPQRTDSGDYTANMGQAALYFDTLRQGYGFQPRYGGEFARKKDIQALIDRHQQAGFVFGNNQKSLFAALLSDDAADGAVARPDLTVSSAYKIPAQAVAGDKRANMVLERAHASPDYSFQADIYLHPANVAARIDEKSFRDRYLVTSSSHWALSGAHQHESYAITTDVTGIVDSLVPKKRRQTWRITAAITTNDKGRGQIRQGDFSLPSIAIVDRQPAPAPVHKEGAK